MNKCICFIVFKSLFNKGNRKHVPRVYRVYTNTSQDIWEEREIAREHEHEVRVFPRTFEFMPNFHK